MLSNQNKISLIDPSDQVFPPKLYNLMIQRAAQDPQATCLHQLHFLQRRDLSNTP